MHDFRRGTRLVKGIASKLGGIITGVCALLYLGFWFYAESDLRPRNASLEWLESADSSHESILSGNLSMQITTNDADCQHFLNRAASPGTHFLGASRSQKPSFLDSIPKQIMFLHYNEVLSQPRRLCSIESAARQNPAHNITIYVRDKERFEEKIRSWRKRAGLDMRLNVKELVWRDAMVGTPLFQWWQENTWKNSTWPDQNLGNAFRLGMMWKQGGVYLDLDIISVNPLSGLGRSVARQDKMNTNNAFFSVEPRDLFVWEVMSEFVLDFRGHKWGHNGPAAVTRTLRKCKLPECVSVNIAETERFFPFNYTVAVDQTYWDKSCAKMREIADQLSTTNPHMVFLRV